LWRAIAAILNHDSRQCLQADGRQHAGTRQLLPRHKPPMASCLGLKTVSAP
jgi:hypothetical protein